MQDEQAEEPELGGDCVARGMHAVGLRCVARGVPAKGRDCVARGMQAVGLRCVARGMAGAGAAVTAAIALLEKYRPKTGIASLRVCRP